MDVIDWVFIVTPILLVLFFGYVAITSRKDVDR